MINDPAVGHCRIGVARALEWVCTANRYGAQEAMQVGLVNKVFENDQLTEEVEKLARRICTQGPCAVRAAKFAMIKSNRTDVGVGFALESSEFGLRFQTPESIEGIQAFAQKRTPNFGG